MKSDETQVSKSAVCARVQYNQAKTLVENYLAISLAQYRGKPKVIPTAQDRECFYGILSGATGYDEWNFTDELPIGGGRTEIEKQWQRVQLALRERLVTASSRFRRTEWVRMSNLVLDRFEMVSITLDSDEDPNIIFSRLNARGTPLGISDLVRNSVFSRFDHQNPAQSEIFYQGHWLPFERTFIKPSGLENYFQPFAIIRTAGKATQASAFADLETRWKGKTPEAVLTDLREYAQYFASLYQFEDIPNLHPRVNAALRDFSEMPKISVSWPFIMQVVRAAHIGQLDWKSAERCLRIVESMLVRRALVGMEPTGLHAIFKSLWNETLGAPKKVASRVQTGTIKTPSNSELLKELRSSRVDQRRILPFVLKQYERARRVEEDTDDDLPVGGGTVEHIAPDSYEQYWSTIFPTSDQQKAVVGLIGNLTLLSGKQNRKLSNQDWPKKRVRYRTSDWLISRELSKKQRWDSHAIRLRTAALAKWVIKRWPPLPPPQNP